MNKILFLAIALFFTGKVLAQAAPIKYGTAANRFKDLYNENKIDDIFNLFSADMQTKLPAPQFRASTKQLKTQLGSLLYVDFMDYKEPSASYKARFQNATLLLNISL